MCDVMSAVELEVKHETAEYFELMEIAEHFELTMEIAEYLTS